MIAITHIISGLEMGGAERALHTLLTGGLQGPFHNRVISLMDEGRYGSLLREAGIPVTCLNLRMGRPRPAAVIGLLRAMRASPADIIQGWMYHGNLAANLAARLNPKTAHLAWNIRSSLGYFQNIKRSTRWAIRAGAALSCRPDAILYNSQRSRDQHEATSYAGPPGRVIPNGFDTSIWRPLAFDRARVRSQLGIAAGSDLLGFVGRNHPQKDLPNLFRALASVMSAFPQLHVILIGRDIDLALKPFGSTLPQDRVHVLGQRNDTAMLMRGFDLFCLSSESEGFPNVIGEAMATGVPCVTTDVGDAAEIVGETGWIVPPRNDGALAESLHAALRLTVDERKSRGSAARARISSRYSLDANVSQYRKLYENLVEGG